MKPTLDILPATPLDLAAVDRAVAEHGRRPEALIPILHDLQDHYNYLPAEALRRIAQLTTITPQAITEVSTFYTRFRHVPAGKHIIRVCHGTACHVKGSGLVEDALRRHLKIAPGHETDAAGEFTIERVGCLGCCTLAPVMQVGPVTYGHRGPDSAHEALHDYLELQKTSPSVDQPHKPKTFSLPMIELRVGAGSCCIAGGSFEVREELERAVARTGAPACVKPVGCVGVCHMTPMVEIVQPGKRPMVYTKVNADDAKVIAKKHLRPQGLWNRLKSAVNGWVDTITEDEPEKPLVRYITDARDTPLCDFVGTQKRIATEHCGYLEPLDLDQYLQHDGYKALRIVLGLSQDSGLSAQHSPPLSPDQIISQIKSSSLRGRGGAGFPTGEKWARVRAAKGDVKYIICNGDEGDPGAFMDRMILESFPFRELEGITIAAIAIGATEGYLYIRHEYPLAVQRIRSAIQIAEQRGLLGNNILGTSHSLHLKVVCGAGAFICGEETALIASIEGERGNPRLKPPFPSDCGLWGKPTCINNVETYAMIPWIIRNGPQAFAYLGTKTSKGTKVFALTGKVKRGGLIEVPMGVSIRHIVEEIGGGVAVGRKFKAVQIGGPSGGCVPASLSDTAIDYESLAAVGAIMGSGGLVVLDDTDCMVDIARYFLQFTQNESCGKCSMCRTGTKVMLEILEKFCAGKARAADLATLERLAENVKIASLCGLGQTAPNPVLTTLKYFRDEYEAHLKGHCPAGRCKPLIKYVVNDACIGCTRCAQDCPSDAIPMTPYQIHTIDPEKCTRCDICRGVCPENAIDIH